MKISKHYYLIVDPVAKNIETALDINATKLAAIVCTAQKLADDYGLRPDQALIKMIEEGHITLADIFGLASIYTSQQIQLLQGIQKTEQIKDETTLH
mgnify:CR=1 FL=1